MFTNNKLVILSKCCNAPINFLDACDECVEQKKVCALSENGICSKCGELHEKNIYYRCPYECGELHEKRGECDKHNVPVVYCVKNAIWLDIN